MEFILCTLVLMAYCIMYIFTFFVFSLGINTSAGVSLVIVVSICGVIYAYNDNYKVVLGVVGVVGLFMLMVALIYALPIFVGTMLFFFIVAVCLLT